MSFSNHSGQSGKNSKQNPTGILSGFLRSYRARQARPYVRGQVLDYGCGQGYFSQFVDKHKYVGVDLNSQVLELARRLNPDHTFLKLDGLPVEARFDTVISLAVIEHVPDPVGFMKVMASHLAPGGRIVLTTPEPSFERIYEWGAAIGLFSSHAADDHESLLGFRQLVEVGNAAGLRLLRYERFLVGANQLAVYECRV